MTERAHRGRWLPRSRRRGRGRGKEEVGGTGKVGEGGGGGGSQRRPQPSQLPAEVEEEEGKDQTRWMETRAPSLRRLITQPCSGIITHQAAVEGVACCGSSSVSTPAVVEKQPTPGCRGLVVSQTHTHTHIAHHGVCNTTVVRQQSTGFPPQKKKVLLITYASLSS